LGVLILISPENQGFQPNDEEPQLLE